ncbi:MAG: hypothetical protein OHK0032_13270 [Thermodesulfovibrionales bacterium]
MIKNPSLLQKFEDSFIKSEPMSFDRAMRLFTALYNEAKTFGVFPPEDPMEGIEVDIRVARIINSCLKQ